MPQDSLTVDFAAFLRALDGADVADLEFVERDIGSHSIAEEKKVGCNLVAVRGIRVPDPKLVPYVRATTFTGISRWYVLDHSLPGRYPYEVVSASSENEAKQIVLARLRAATARIVDSPENRYFCSDKE